MKWEGHRQSENVEDRRGQSAPGGRPRVGGRGIGIGSLVIALLVGWLFGINPLTVLGLLGGGGPEPALTQPPAQRSPAQDRLATFVSTVLADTEDVWQGVFQAGGQDYRPAPLVLFEGVTPTACGSGDSAMGPFYCPGDAKVYIDLRFFRELHERLGAPGDFAQAYVVAHEVGHHIQNLMGITAQVERQRTRLSPAKANELSVRVELQADCLAGVWAHHSQKGKGWLERGDVEEGLQAASAIGDDTLQRRSQGRVVPESFTHGSSAQRVRWFRTGLDSGNLKLCNTFQAGTL